MERFGGRRQAMQTPSEVGLHSRQAGSVLFCVECWSWDVLAFCLDNAINTDDASTDGMHACMCMDCVVHHHNVGPQSGRGVWSAAAVHSAAIAAVLVAFCRAPLAAAG